MRIKGLSIEEEFWEEKKVKGKKVYDYWVLMKLIKPEYANFNLAQFQTKNPYGIMPI